MTNNIVININSKNDLPFTLTDTVLGEGKSSTVFLAYKGSDKFAIKKVTVEKAVSHDICLEGIIMNKVNHRNLPKFYGLYKDSKYYYLAMEYIDGITLIEYLDINKKMDLVKLKDVSRQLVDAIKYLHTNNIVHRDIKLDNVMLEKQSGRIVIIDFGFAGIITYGRHGESKFSNFCGTYYYAAPEIWDNDPYYGRPVDIWSMGVTVYSLMKGYFPYNTRKNEDKYIYREIRDSKVSYDGTNKDLDNFIKSALTIDPNKRVNILSLSQSPWIKNN